MALMVFSDQLGGEYILMVFPGIVSGGITFPLHKVLKIAISSEIVMICNGLDFKLFFSVDDVWGGVSESCHCIGGFP